MSEANNEEKVVNSALEIKRANFEDHSTYFVCLMTKLVIKRRA
jgi:hypothetical protein